jgi:hypothetical protein
VYWTKRDFRDSCSHSSSPTACAVWHITVSFAYDQCWRFVSPSFCAVLFVRKLVGPKTSLRVILLLRLTNRLHRDVFLMRFAIFSLTQLAEWHCWNFKRYPPPPPPKYRVGKYKKKKKIRSPLETKQPFSLVPPLMQSMLSAFGFCFVWWINRRVLLPTASAACSLISPTK